MKVRKFAFASIGIPLLRDEEVEGNVPAHRRHCSTERGDDELLFGEDLVVVLVWASCWIVGLAGDIDL